MTETDRRVIDFDHHSAEYGKNFVQMQQEMRSKCPVAWSEHHEGFWYVTSHEHGNAVFRDHDTFTSSKWLDENGVKRGGIIVPSNPSLDLIPDETDPPEWNKYRRVLNPPFAPAAIDRMRPRLLELTTQVLDDLVERGEMDLLYDVANPIPALSTLDILGLPHEDLSHYAIPFHDIVWVPPGSEHWTRTLQGFDHMAVLLQQAVDDHRAHPKQDLIGSLIDERIDGEPIADDIIVRICMQILGGGIDTTTALLSNVFMYLNDHVELRGQLVDDPRLLQLATEEFLRFFSPVQALGRTVSKPVTLDGQIMCPGEVILVSHGSMNRDENVFEAPDELIPDRQPNRHAGFGLGIHRCLGSNLARATFQVILVEVLKRMPDYQIDVERSQKYPSASAVNGWISMPCTFTPGQRSNHEVR